MTDTTAHPTGDATGDATGVVTILGPPQSNVVWTVRLFAAERGLACVLEPAAPHSSEVLAIHPLGKVPVMRHGSVTLSESRAICSYLDAAFPGQRLTPADPVAAAQEEQWIAMAMTAIDPVCVRGYLLGHLMPGTPDNTPDQARIGPALPKMMAQLDMLEAALGDGRLGQRPFQAPDAWLVPILFYLRILPESAAAIAARPHLSAYLERHLARPTVQATRPHPWIDPTRSDPSSAGETPIRRVGAGFTGSCCRPARAAGTFKKNLREFV